MLLKHTIPTSARIYTQRLARRQNSIASHGWRERGRRWMDTWFCHQVRCRCLEEGMGEGEMSTKRETHATHPSCPHPTIKRIAIPPMAKTTRQGRRNRGAEKGRFSKMVDGGGDGAGGAEQGANGRLFRRGVVDRGTWRLPASDAGAAFPAATAAVCRAAEEQGSLHASSPR